MSFITGCSSASSALSSSAASQGVASTVSAIAISPLTLSPAFSPSIDNYVVRCASGANPVTLTTTDASGTTSVALELVEDGVVVVDGKYWIRCLPHDFPTITVAPHHENGMPTPGWYLVGTAKIADPTSGFAMVLDTNGTPVWYERAGTVLDIDSFAPNTLSFMPWATAPFGYDTTASFRVLALATATTTKLAAAGGVATDGHELRMLPNGNHVVLTYPIQTGFALPNVQVSDSSAAIANCQIQEVDPSGNLVWSWLASDHFDPVKESVEPTPYVVDGQTIIDVFHCHSVDIDATGNLLVSSRHMNAVFYIEKSSGKVLWKMGGVPVNKDGATYITIAGDDETAFNMQHDARFQANGDISLFDDHGETAGSGVGRAVEYTVDHTSNTATVAFELSGTVQSTFMGSFRRYADGESVVGWGGATPDDRALTELNAAGADVLDIAFGGGDASYRAVKVPIAQLDVDLLRANVVPSSLSSPVSTSGN